MQKKNNFYSTERFGLIMGLIIPVFVILGFYFYRNAQSISSFIDNIVGMGIISQLVSLCVVPNLLLFFIFMWKNNLRPARGVIGATFIYALIVLSLKMFLGSGI
jgi:RsiW-degrading membrane proteinase PrsW (M82 family)